MEKAYKLEFANEETDGLFVNCCGCSRTEPLHSFGPALKPHFLIHYVLSGKGKFILRGQEYFLEAGSGFLIEPGELAFYQSEEMEPWSVSGLPMAYTVSPFLTSEERTYSTQGKAEVTDFPSSVVRLTRKTMKSESLS